MATAVEGDDAVEDFVAKRAAAVVCLRALARSPAVGESGGRERFHNVCGRLTPWAGEKGSADGCLLALLAGARQESLSRGLDFTNCVDRAFNGFLIPLLGLIVFPYATTVLRSCLQTVSGDWQVGGDLCGPRLCFDIGTGSRSVWMVGSVMRAHSRATRPAHTVPRIFLDLVSNTNTHARGQSGRTARDSGPPGPCAIVVRAVPQDRTVAFLASPDMNNARGQRRSCGVGAREK